MQQEFERIRERFGLPEGIFDLQAYQQVVVEDPQSIEMNAKAHPYWTVLPGENHLATVCAGVRFAEFAYDILQDPRLAAEAESGACVFQSPSTAQTRTPSA